MRTSPYSKASCLSLCQSTYRAILSLMWLFLWAWV
nr:MAG TPA: hypothetical protein [Caudoviricetes sp.]